MGQKENEMSKREMTVEYLKEMVKKSFANVDVDDKGKMCVLPYQSLVDTVDLYENKLAKQQAEIERLNKQAERASVCEKDYLEWATGFLRTRFDIKDWFTNPEHQRTPCTYEFFASTLWLKIESAIKWLIELEERNDQLRRENIDFRLQVDKLNKKIIAQESVFHNLVIVEKDKSVKITAKEILILAEDYNYGYEPNMDNFMLALKERYGVDVE